jgi:hypothetical protein
VSQPGDQSELISTEIVFMSHSRRPLSSLTPWFRTDWETQVASRCVSRNEFAALQNKFASPCFSHRLLPDMIEFLSDMEEHPEISAAASA